MDLLYVSHPSIETLYPLTVKEKPVSSIQLIGKTLLEHIYEKVTKAGIKNLIHFTNKYDNSILEDVYALENIITVNCDLIKNCLKQTNNKIIEKEYIIVKLGTILPSTEKIYDSIIARWNEVGGDILLVLTPGFQIPETQSFLSLKIEVDLNSSDIDKNKIGKTSRGGYNFTGIMLLRTRFLNELFEYIQKYVYNDSDNELTFSISKFLEKVNGTITYHILTLPVYPVNTPWNFLYTVQEMLNKLKGQQISNEADVSPTAIIEGPVTIEKGALIDHGAVIKGPVYIGRNTLVGANSFIRDHVSMEENSIVGALSEVKRTYIGRRATIASHSHITDSLLGDNAVIRPMSVTLNYEPQSKLEFKEYRKRGSIIGEHSIVDGGSVLRPSTVIEPYTAYKRASEF